MKINKNLLSLYIFTLILNLLVSTGLANQQCIANYHSSDWVEIPAGSVYWGSYTCKNCGIVTTAKPKDDGVTKCSNCQKSHAGEPFIEPITKNVGGRLFVLNPSGINQQREAAESGLKWECPTCKVHQPGNLDYDGGVGAEKDDVKVYGQQKTQKTYVQPDDFYRKSSDGTFVDGSGRWKREPWKAWLTYGTTFIAAIGATAIIWGTHTFKETGYIANVERDKIVVEYNHKGVSHSFFLSPDALQSGVIWHEGEPVTLHFSNFTWLNKKVPSGAERSNAETYSLESYAPVVMEKEGEE